MCIDRHRHDDLQFLASMPRVQWNSLQEIFLADTVADVLFIMDCCNALSAIQEGHASHPGTATLWAACSVHETTPQSGPDAFTENLIVELREIGNEGRDVEDINKSLVLRIRDIQSLNQVLKRNLPYCVTIDHSRENRRIRLKALQVQADEETCQYSENTNTKPSADHSRDRTNDAEHIDAVSTESSHLDHDEEDKEDAAKHIW